MQFRLPALLALLTTWSAASAQTLTVSGPQISFGTTTELAPVARTLTVSNPTASPITVTDAHLFGTYGQPAFGVTPATFTVAPGGSQTITVTFAPLHNIAHNSELVLVTDRLGAVRVDLLGQGHYSRSYYNNTENLSEQALLDALKQITTAGHNALGYNTGRDRMFMTIDNKRVNGQGASVNTLECIYTGRQITGYTSRSAAQNQGFNTEHTWPQSLFSSANPMQSDLHHLFPTDDAANNSRSNNPFGIATQPYRNDNINAPSHLGNNNRYEPRDPQKGRTARAMLYFVTRYQNYSGYFNSQQSILRQWHHQFPVTQVDRRRNDDVLTAQGNRNPFIDYPQFVDRITNFVGNPSVAADSLALWPSASTIEYGVVSGPATYSFVLVNTGNQPVNLSSIGTTPVQDPGINGFTVTRLGSSAGPVAPGEAVVLEIALDPGTATGSGLFNLNLSTSLPGAGSSLTVPITFNLGPTATPREISSLFSLDLYPNPATDELTIVRHSANPALTGSRAYEVELLDGLGRIVIHQAASEEMTTLRVGHLPAGLYVVRAGGLTRRLMVR